MITYNKANKSTKKKRRDTSKAMPEAKLNNVLQRNYPSGIENQLS